MSLHCGSDSRKLMVCIRKACSASGVESLGWPVSGVVAFRKVTAGSVPPFATKFQDRAADTGDWLDRYGRSAPANSAASDAGWRWRPNIRRARSADYRYYRTEQCHSRSLSDRSPHRTTLT